MMDESDLYAILVLLIERAGSVEISADEAQNMSLEGKVLAIHPEGDTLRLSIELEEDIDAEFTSAETD